MSRLAWPNTIWLILQLSVRNFNFCHQYDRNWANNLLIIYWLLQYSTFIIFILRINFSWSDFETRGAVKIYSNSGKIDQNGCGENWISLGAHVDMCEKTIFISISTHFDLFEIIRRSFQSSLTAYVTPGLG